MTFKALQNLITNTTAYTAVGASQLVLPASVISMLSTQLAGGFYTAVSVTDGVNYEVMNITSVTAGAADIVRGQDGTVAVPLASGSQVRFVWTTQGIADVAPGGAVTLVGSGATTVTGGPNYNVSSQFVQVLGGVGINVSGAYPNFTIDSSLVVPPAVTVTASGIATASGGPVNYNIDVAVPIFTSGGGISITGTWPNITITNTSTATGTMTNLVAGPGIAITGATPSINPTVSLVTVGPGAGTYGGIQLNAYGQVVAFTGSLITSVVTTTNGFTISGPVNGVLTLNITSATVSQQGLVSLAQSTVIASRDPANATQAVTPAGLDAVCDALELTVQPASIDASGAQNGVAPALYTNTISGISLAVPAIASGRNAIIDVYVECYDPVAPTVQQTFGIALFQSSTFLEGVSNSFASNVRHLRHKITGPFSPTTLSVKTTPLSGTQVLGSYYAYIINN